MLPIRTVLCPLDFTGLDRSEIAIATEVCRAFGAKLVLHHNVGAAEPGFSRAWEWRAAQAAHGGEAPDVERHMRDLLAEVQREVAAEAVVTSGPLASTVQTLAERLPADLIVLGSHGWSTQDHASLTERLVDQSPCPVLTFQESLATTQRFRLRLEANGKRVPVVVATDLARESTGALAYAYALARALPIRLDLLHVLTGDQSDAAVSQAHVALDAHVPPDMVDRVSAHVRIGPAADTIVQYVDEAEAAFLVIGEHAHGWLRRVLTRDTARAVVHDVRCPVWVVPPRVPTAAA